MNTQITIRLATADDAFALAAIYAPYVQKTAITFEYEPPSVDEFAGRMRHVMSMYPYIVAEVQGKPVGYAYASTFKGRPAYDWAVETSIYVAQGYSGLGIGRALHDALRRALQAQGILNMYACIAVPCGEDDETLTRNSEHFHAHLGYRLVGEFERCGCKGGRWYDMVWMELIIGEHLVEQPPVVPFPQIVEAGYTL